MQKTIFLMLILFVTFSQRSYALVSVDTINNYKSLTRREVLDNNIPVIYRHIPNSDIVNITVSFDFGTKDFKKYEAETLESLFAIMPFSARGYSKDKIFALNSKYSTGVGCSAGIEVSRCAIQTIDDYWDDIMPWFSAVVKTPSLNDEDIFLVRDRTKAGIKYAMSVPDRLVNDVVNRVFYPKDHPYYSQYAESLGALSKLKRVDLQNVHKAILDPSKISIVVVGNIERTKLIKDLNKYFGNIAVLDNSESQVIPEEPIFNKKSEIAFESRQLPVAYVSLKFNGVSIREPSIFASNVMMTVLHERLWDEVRTKRSLTYSVSAFPISHSVGIGTISFSTDKIKETLNAISQVIDEMKTKELTKTALNEYKNKYVTSYFMSQETNAAIAGSLSYYFHYFKTSDYFYNLPQNIEVVTPSDVKSVANKMLKNFRVGVVYDKAKYRSSVFNNFLRKYNQR